MRRDLELAHKLLYFVEEKGQRIFKGSIIIEGYERDAVVDHLYLLNDVGYINMGNETLADKGPLVLTWKGCDYLDELRAKQAKAVSQQQKPQQRPAQKQTAQKQTAQKPQQAKPAAQKPPQAKPAAQKPQQPKQAPAKKPVTQQPTAQQAPAQQAPAQQPAPAAEPQPTV